MTTDFSLVSFIDGVIIFPDWCIPTPANQGPGPGVIQQEVIMGQGSDGSNTFYGTGTIDD